MGVRAMSSSRIVIETYRPMGAVGMPSRVWSTNSDAEEISLADLVPRTMELRERFMVEPLTLHDGSQAFVGVGVLVILRVEEVR